MGSKTSRVINYDYDLVIVLGPRRVYRSILRVHMFYRISHNLVVVQISKQELKRY
jgi:hypothetical protein